MGLVSFPSTICYNAIMSTSLPLVSQASNLQKFSLQKNLHLKACVVDNFRSTFPHQPRIQTSFSSRHRGLSLVPFDSKTPGSGEEDHRALETVYKLYSSIKKQNIRELSGIISDECHYVCNIITSVFQPFYGKKQVLDCFSYLIRSLDNSIEFIVRPSTMHKGMSVDFLWNLGTLPFNLKLSVGKGFSFHTMLDYHVKVILRNVEMYIEPLLHIEPLRLTIMAYAKAITDKMSTNSAFKGKIVKALGILLVLFVMAAILFLLKPRLY